MHFDKFLTSTYCWNFAKQIYGEPDKMVDPTQSECNGNSLLRYQSSIINLTLNVPFMELKKMSTKGTLIKK